MKNILKNSVIFLTGGTGSFGKEFVQLTLKKFKPKKIIIYSRDEMKQWDMQNEYLNNKSLKFVIGDIRDKERLISQMSGSDYVVHAAATKIVPTAEYNPTECIKTNVEGAINVIDASIANKIKKVIALSTDKACNPVNLYGATKLASDKLFIAINANDNIKTQFSIVRYGNVFGSRGSIIPFFKSLKKNQPFPITSTKMTRFVISLEDAVKTVWYAFQEMHGGEIFVKKIPSVKIVDLAMSIDPKRKHKIIGIRPGEKLDELMINEEDAYYTYEFKDYYKILSPLNDMHKSEKRIKNGKKVKTNFIYRSDQNKSWVPRKKLEKIIKKIY